MEREKLEYTFRSNFQRDEKYAQYLWSEGNPRPSLLERDQVLALEGLAKGWTGVPAGFDCGDLTVLGYCYRVAKGQRQKGLGWQAYCTCKCGWEGALPVRYLTKKHMKRCPKCSIKDRAGWKYQDIIPDYNLRRHLLQRIDRLIARCNNNKDPQYMGIKVYKPWVKNRGAFLRYVQTLPGWDDPKNNIYRLEHEKGVVPGNIRFGRHNTKYKPVTHKVSELEAEITKLKEENAKLNRIVKRIRACV